MMMWGIELGKKTLRNLESMFRLIVIVALLAYK